MSVLRYILLAWIALSLIPFIHMGYRWLRFRSKRKQMVRVLRHANRKLRRHILLVPAEGNLIVLWAKQGFVRADYFCQIRHGHSRFLLRFNPLPLPIIAHMLRTIELWLESRAAYANAMARIPRLT